jgi:cytoskeletal protein CcmA (bactofilin family)
MEMKTVFGSMMDFDNASRPEGPDPIQPIEEEEPAPKKKQRLPEILDLNDFPDASDEDEAEEEANEGSYNPFRGVSFDEPKEEPKEEAAPVEEEDSAEEDDNDLFLSEDLFAKEEPKEEPEEGNGAKMTDGFVVRGEHAEIVVTADHARVDSKLSGTVTCHSLTVGSAGIDGKICSDADVVLSDLSDVRGEIHAKKIEVYGTFHGTLSAEEELVVHDSARVFGTMESFGSVEIHPGAVLSGTAFFRTKEDEDEEDDDAFLLSEPEESVPDTKELFPVEEEEKEKKAPIPKKTPEQEPVMNEDEEDEPDLDFDETDGPSSVTEEESEEEPKEEPKENSEEDPTEPEDNKEVPEEENQPKNVVVPDDAEDSDDLDDVDLPSSFFDEAEV